MFQITIFRNMYMYLYKNVGFFHTLHYQYLLSYYN